MRSYRLLRESFHLFKAFADRFFDEFGARFVASLVAREDFVYLLDQFLWDADGNESASTRDGCPQPVTPRWVKYE